MSDPEDALMAALAEHGGGHGYRAAAREALSLLNQRGWSLVRADPFDLSARNALVAAFDGVELTREEHSCGEECWEGPVPRDPTHVADELIDALTAAGWSLVRPDPFAAAKPPSGCCGGWVGPDGQRSMCCPVVTDMFAAGPSDEELGSTNAPAVGGADAEPGDLAERLEYVEAIVLGRDGPSVLDTLAERLTALEDKLATWIPQEQA